MPGDVAACPACGKANPAARFQPVVAPQTPAPVPAVAGGYTPTQYSPAQFSPGGALPYQAPPPGPPMLPAQLPYQPGYGAVPPLGAARSGGRGARLAAIFVIAAVASAFAGLLLLGHSKLHDVSVPARLGGYDKVDIPAIDQEISTMQSDLQPSDAGAKVVGAVYGNGASDPQIIMFLGRTSKVIPNSNSEIDQFAQGFDQSGAGSISAASATTVTLSGENYSCWEVSSVNSGLCMWVDSNVFGAVLCKGESVDQTATVAAEARANGET